MKNEYKEKILGTGMFVFWGFYFTLIVVFKKIAWVIFWLVCFYLFVFVFN